MNTIKHLIFLGLVFCVIRSAPARPETRVWQSQAVAIITFGYICTLAVGVKRAPRRRIIDPPTLYELQDRAAKTMSSRDPLGFLAKAPWKAGDL